MTSSSSSRAVGGAAGPRWVRSFARSSAARAVVREPRDDGAWADLLGSAGGRGLTVRGAGASYSDAALNSGGTVAVTTGHHDVRAWDDESGIIEVDAGLTLARLLAFTVPRGWSLPVLPGTARITVGGALAADVHGKNHVSRGSFSRHVVDAELMTPSAGLLRIGPRTRPDVFWATTGGLGLTGVLLRVRLQLVRVETSWLAVRNAACADLDGVLTTMLESGRHHEHVVAWIDGHASGAATGRGVVSGASALAFDELPALLRSRALRHRPAGRPISTPSVADVMRPGLVRAAGATRFAAARHRRTPRIRGSHAVLHPLDAAVDWPALYGPRGFVQQQFSVPDGQEGVLGSFLRGLTAAGCPPSLVVLKRLGTAAPGPLSFPSPGWTLAADLPAGPAAGAAPALDRLDDLVLAAGGRIYLVKDARLRRAVVPEMYPRLDEWRTVRWRLDPAGVLTSDLDRRLDLSGRAGGGRRC